MKSKKTLDEAIQFLKSHNLYLQSDIHIAGSIRRKKEFIGDIDIVCTNRQKIIDILSSYNYKILRGDLQTGAFIQVEIDDQQIDIKMISPESLPFTMLHSTGSAEFNIALRSIAKKKGYTLNEYGLTRLSDGFKLHAKSESDIFHFFSYLDIKPEHRTVGDISEAFNLLKCYKMKEYRNTMYSDRRGY